MKRSIDLVILLNLSAFFFLGCKRPDSDVSSSPQYNFSSLAGTIWKTKIDVVVVDIEHSPGNHYIDLLTCEIFDPKNPDALPVPNGREIAVLPVGTRVQIGQLMKNNGNSGLLRVTVTVLGSTNFGYQTYIDRYLLAKNRFLFPGDSSSTTWGVDERVLEK